MGGIYSGLIHSSSQKNLVLGCDTPFFSDHLLRSLTENFSDEDALVTEHNGKAEPLCAIYDRNCIPHFHTLLKQGKLKVIDALQGLKTVLINFDKEAWLTKNEFANINTPEELKKYSNTIK